MDADLQTICKSEVPVVHFIECAPNDCVSGRGYFHYTTVPTGEIGILTEVTMKIYEAFSNIKIRREFKSFLIATGLTLTKADKTYTHFGAYLTRLKGVGYDVKLLKCETEREIRTELEEIFYTKWINNIGYPEVPPLFFMYIDFLHTWQVKDPTLGIEGLDEGLYPDLQWAISQGLHSKYELPFLKDNKLSIIVNPVLIKKLIDENAAHPDKLDAMVRVCSEFYKPLKLQMTDEDWSALIPTAVTTSRPRKNKSIVRNILITYPDGGHKVMGGNEAIESVARMIGFEQLKKCNLKHLRHPLLTKTVIEKYKLFFKEFAEGYYLNMLGTSTDKYKTIYALNSIYRLNLTVQLTNEEAVPVAQKAPAKKSVRRRKAYTRRGPKSCDAPVDRQPVPIPVLPQYSGTAQSGAEAAEWGRRDAATQPHD